MLLSQPPPLRQDFSGIMREEVGLLATSLSRLVSATPMALIPQQVPTAVSQP